MDARALNPSSNPLGEMHQVPPLGVAEIGRDLRVVRADLTNQVGHKGCACMRQGQGLRAPIGCVRSALDQSLPVKSGDNGERA